MLPTTISTLPVQESPAVRCPDPEIEAFPSCRSDRAAAVAVAVLQIMTTAPCQQLRQQVEQYLRDEFADERRQAIADREPIDA